MILAVASQGKPHIPCFVGGPALASGAERQTLRASPVEKHPPDNGGEGLPPSLFLRPHPFGHPFGLYAPSGAPGGRPPRAGAP